MAAVLGLSAYGMLLRGRVGSQALSYLLLNAFSSVGMGICTAAAGAWPSVAVNAVWFALGVGPLRRALRERAAQNPRSRRGPVSPRALGGATATSALTTDAPKAAACTSSRA
jgi:hypothetical protein